jgi:hypothetical protein
MIQYAQAVRLGGFKIRNPGWRARNMVLDRMKHGDDRRGVGNEVRSHVEG